MKILEKFLGSALLMEIPRFEDRRGSFSKIYAREMLHGAGIDMEVREVYYSISKRNVIRGMHFQAPPAHHAKLVTVACGTVRDVILDLRKDSPYYGKSSAVLLSADEARTLYIPPGFAHGFLSLEDHTFMQYLVSTEHSPEHDAGIRWDSFGYDWGVSEPVISERDSTLVPFGGFTSPF